MLRSIDVLIGLSVVMLMVSMSVTLITQFVTTTVNTRGGHLRRGLSDLLQQLDPALTKGISKEISTAVLRHPLVSDVGRRLATVVGRGEFTKLLMDLAAGNGPQKLEGAALDALKKALANNGVADPAASLENIRSFALTLEKSNPELANDVRVNAAIMHEAGSQFVAKIHGWFDQTIDRVSGRFTASTRVITVVVALLVAFAIQLDSLALVNRLSTDTQLRQSLVLAANRVDQGQSPSQTVSKEGNPPGNTNSSEGEGGSKKDVVTQPPSVSTQNPPVPSRVVRDVDAILGSTGLISAPDWKSFTAQKVLGIILSAILLTLGAPFWYNTLKTGLRLRAVIADKDDQQRLERQTTQESAQASSTTNAGMTSDRGAVAGSGGDLDRGNLDLKG